MLAAEIEKILHCGGPDFNALQCLSFRAWIERPQKETKHYVKWWNMELSHLVYMGNIETWYIFLKCFSCWCILPVCHDFWNMKPASNCFLADCKNPKPNVGKQVLSFIQLQMFPPIISSFLSNLYIRITFELDLIVWSEIHIYIFRKKCSLLWPAIVKACVVSWFHVIPVLISDIRNVLKPF